MLLDDTINPIIRPLVGELAAQATALFELVAEVARDDFNLPEEAHHADLTQELLARRPALAFDVQGAEKRANARLAVKRDLELMFADCPELAWQDPGVHAIAGPGLTGETFKQWRTFAEGAGPAGRRRYYVQRARELRAAGKSIEVLPRPPIPRAKAENVGAESDWRSRARLGVLPTRRQLPNGELEAAPSAAPEMPAEQQAAQAATRALGIPTDPLWSTARCEKEIAAFKAAKAAKE